MFICQKCGKTSKKQNRIIIERREKKYRYYVIKIRKPFGKTDTIITEDKRIVDNLPEGDKLAREYFAKGWEIIRELVLCKECYEKKTK